MKRIILSLAALALLCTPALATPEKAGDAAKGRFAVMDSDNDGKISRDEFFKAQPEMKDAAFVAIDKSNDGFITEQEWKDFMLGHGKGEGGMMPPMPPAGGEGNAPAPKSNGPDLIMPPAVGKN